MKQINIVNGPQNASVIIQGCMKMGSEKFSSDPIFLSCASVLYDRGVTDRVQPFYELISQIKTEKRIRRN